MKHPHIVACESAQIINHPNGDIEYLILLEYCDGGNLLDWINSPQHASHTNKDVIAIFRQFVDAVAVLHAHQPPIRHQDLKAENFLYSTETGVWKLCDMGSSTTDNFVIKSSGDRVTVGSMIEKTTTPSYRSPEMCDLFSGLPITHQSDVWAIGVILYTMMFREQPFPDGNLATLSGKYHIPENHKWNPKLIHILSRCFVKDPSQRITVPALQVMLAELAGTPVRHVAPWTMFQPPVVAAITATATASGGNTSTPATTKQATTPSNAKSPPPIPARPANPTKVVPTSSPSVAPPSVPPPTDFDADDFNPAFPDPSASPVTQSTPTTSQATKFAIHPPTGSPTSSASSTPKLVPKIAAAPVKIGAIKLPNSHPPAGAHSSSSSSVAPVNASSHDDSERSKKSKKTKSKSHDEPAEQVDDSDDDEEDVAKTHAKLVKKCTRDDATPAKGKHLAKLLSASWIHRPDVAHTHAQQLQQHQLHPTTTHAPLTLDDLARHMLAWEGLPAVFPALLKRPFNKPFVAWKSLLLIHRLLQGGSPPLLGQVYVHRRFLEQIETQWVGELQTPASNAAPVSSLIAPYAKHLLHRLAFHQLHPHYEGSFALGHFLWSQTRLKPSSSTTPPPLEPKLVRDDVHHLLQLMAEALRLSSACLLPTLSTSAGAPSSSTSLDESSLALRHQLLVTLLDDLESMYLTCTFMLAQLCLLLGVRSGDPPPGWPNGVVKRDMLERHISSPSPVTPTSPTSTSSHASLPTAIPLTSGTELEEGDLEIPLDTPPSTIDEDQLLRAIPTLLQAHRTIRERLQGLLHSAHSSSVLRDLRPTKSTIVADDQLTPCSGAMTLQHFPPASLIPLTRTENARLCETIQHANRAIGLTKHRGIGRKLTFVQVMAPVTPTTNTTAPPSSTATTAPSNQPPTPSRSTTEPVRVVLTPFQHASSAPSPTAAATTAVKPLTAASPSSSSLSVSTSTPASSPQSHTLAPRTAVDPFASPTSPLTSPNALLIGRTTSSPTSATGVSSSEATSTPPVDDDPFSSSSNGDDPFGSASGVSHGASGGESHDPFASNSQADDPFAGASSSSQAAFADGVDPFATFMPPQASESQVQTNAISPPPPASGSPPISSPGSSSPPALPPYSTPFSPEIEEQSKIAVTPFDRQMTGEEQPNVDEHDEIDDRDGDEDHHADGHSHEFGGDSENDDDSDDDGEAMLSRGPAKVRTEADYLPADYVRPTKGASSSSTHSPFDDHHSADDHEDESDDESVNGEADDSNVWSQQVDDTSLPPPPLPPHPSADFTPFSEDPFTEAENDAAVAGGASSSLIDEATPFDDMLTKPLPPPIEPSPFDDLPESSTAVASSSSSSMPLTAVSSNTAKSASVASAFFPFENELVPTSLPPSSTDATSGNPFDLDEEDVISAHPPHSSLPSSTSSVPSSSSSSVGPLLPDEIDLSELTFDHLIGRGAFAEVFSGEWRSSEVAIKRLYASRFVSEAARKEFRDEIQLLRNLRHPNILLFVRHEMHTSHLVMTY